MTEDQKIYQEIGKLLYSIMPEDASFIRYRGPIMKIISKLVRFGLTIMIKRNILMSNPGVFMRQ